MPGPIDITSLSPEELVTLTAGSSPPSAPAGGGEAAPAQTAQSGPIDITKLGPEQLRRLTAPASDIGVGESFLRGTGEGATFGYEGKLGISEEAREASKKANPWAHFAGEAAGSFIPMVAAMALPTGATQVAAGARGASLLNKAGQLARSALVPSGEIRNVGQAIGQGSKLGLTYGALSGSGHAGVKDEDPIDEALVKRGLGALKGAAVGVPLGAGLGAAGHGLSRLVGAAINRMSPELNDVIAAASTQELQGIRDVVRNAGYDKYTMADFEALRNRLQDPAQRHLYQDLNLIEALEMSRVKSMPGTGELMVEPKVSPNLSWMAQENANTGGAGAQQAGQNFAARKQAMSSAIQQDIDLTFGKEQSLGNALATQTQNFGRVRNTPSVAQDAEALPTLIDTHFGSGNRAADAEALEGMRTQLGKSYGQLKKKPKELIDEDSQLNKMAERVPELRKALDETLKNDLIRQAQTALEKPGESTAMQQMWGSGELGQRILSPQHLLDVHHALVMNAKPRVGGDASQERISGMLKNWYSQWLDKRLAGHEGLREQYAIYKQMVEADGLGARMPLLGGKQTESVQFINKVAQEQAESLREMHRLRLAYDRDMARWQAGDLKNQPRYTELAAEYRAYGQRQQVVEAFRRSWGEAMRDQLASGGKADKLVRDALTPEGQRRIAQVLGDRDGPALIRDLMQIEARNQGRSLGLIRGGQDAQALAFFQRAERAGDVDVINAFKQAWGDAIKQELANTGKGGPTRVVDDLLTQEGKARLLQILGREDGKTFIESLYNKRQQLGLSQRLYGNSDTAWKFNRQSKGAALMDAAHGLFTFRPEQFLQGLKTLGSAAFQQRRADQGNALLSKQGPEKVTEIIDAILARNQLLTTGQPYVLNPTLRGVGPYVGTIPGQGRLPWDSPPEQRRSQTLDINKPGTKTIRIP